MKTAAPIPFAGSQLSKTRLVCAFFNSAEEERGLTALFGLVWTAKFTFVSV